MTTTLEAALPKLAEGKTLSETESESILGEILDGSADNLHIAAFLMALRQRGETLNEVTGAARAMRARMSRIAAPDNAIDTCGTGGDNSGSYNISTATSFTVAAGGIPVAKHGNRAASSRCGAADVLLALGVNLDCPMSGAGNITARSRLRVPDGAASSLGDATCSARARRAENSHAV